MWLSFPGEPAEQSQQSFVVNSHPRVSCTISVLPFLLDLVGSFLGSDLIFWLFVFFFILCQFIQGDNGASGELTKKGNYKCKNQRDIGREIKQEC